MANFHFKLTPNVRTEGTEGNLDVSVVNGKSIQRTAYIEVPNGSTKLVGYHKDGVTFSNNVTDFTDLPGVVVVELD